MATGIEIPYATREEADIEEIFRIIWLGWNYEGADILGEIHTAASRLYAMGYRKIDGAEQC